MFLRCIIVCILLMLDTNSYQLQHIRVIIMQKNIQNLIYLPKYAQSVDGHLNGEKSGKKYGCYNKNISR